MPYPDMTTEERLERIESILRSNGMHESTCPAHNPYKDSFSNIFQSMAEKSCDCWISLDRPETDPSKAFGVCHIENKEVEQNFFASTRYEVKKSVLNARPDLSEDPKAPNYWHKTFYIVPVDLIQAPESD